jgi:lipoate-protein ligase A
VSGWSLIRRRSTAGEFHALEIPDPARPEVWVHELTDRALVLGSTQRGPGIADETACAEAGVQIVRRRSGGGAVLLIPGDVVWVDVIVPAGYEGWADDIHRPMVWLGERLAEAFRAAGVPGAEVHRGGMLSTDHSRLICFDGLGPGELTIDGAKLVGISQRRTRAAARLQCCWYNQYDPRALPELLVEAPDVAELNAVAIIGRGTALAVIDHLVGVLGA